MSEDQDSEDHAIEADLKEYFEDVDWECPHCGSEKIVRSWGTVNGKLVRVWECLSCEERWD